MKIIFSSYDDISNPYYGGGGARSIHEIAQRISTTHDVTVITSTYPQAKKERVDGVLYKRIGISWGGPLLSQLVFQFILPFYSFFLTYDLWIESFTPPFSTAFIPLFTRKPVIGLTQLLGAEDMSRKYHLPFWMVERLGLKLYRYFVVLTPYLLRKIRRDNRSARIEVIPNGIDKNLLLKSVDTKRQHILYLGRIDIRQKGLDLLLRSYGRIQAQIPYDLIIAGGGTEQDTNSLKKMIERLHLTERVHLVGSVSGSQKDTLFNQSVFVVVPSRFESFGIVILESFCFGSPVVVFDTEDLEWVPSAAAIKVTPFSTEEYASALVTLSRDTDKLMTMREAAKQFIKEYDWDRIAGRYSAFISQITEDKA